jgi:hypothetical protein
MFTVSFWPNNKPSIMAISNFPSDNYILGAYEALVALLSSFLYT